MATPGPGLPEDLPTHRRALVRVRRHLDWARSDGIGRLIEEDQLDPRDRVRLALRRRRWRRAHPRPPGGARPVLLLGVQRSGTNMVTRGLERDPAVEVRNENDGATFERFRLRDLHVVDAVIDDSRHDVVLLKALCDSHRAQQLLDRLGDHDGRPAPRALWVHRHHVARARSAVAKFGDVNRRVLADIAAGGGADRWQAGGLDDDDIADLARLDPASMDAHSAAALFWWVRNSRVFALGIADRQDVALVAYEDMVERPDVTTQRVCDHLGIAYRPALHVHVEAGRTSVADLDLDPRVRQRCEDLRERLVAAGRRP